MSESQPYNVFGYGSLIFKPPPHVIAQVPGFLKGYVRRFAQKSHDHRGTPEVGSNLLQIGKQTQLDPTTFRQNPGRVVTLVHKEDWDLFSGSDAFPDDDIVWGITYTIDPAHAAEVREYLDYREKASHIVDGYTMEVIDVWGVVDGKEKVIVPGCYVGRNDNPSFLGSEPLDLLARRIWESVGPSGRNKDYLFQLATAVHQLSPDSRDSHLFALEAKVRQLDAAARNTNHTNIPH
ncbi:hypothetical protein HGRIS_007333 [Hohenbuehelia grisea]|uniref:glutathione-specific gamma-glutamylcyclotransferase n=1 Tax=Hohenbuehelia grisea TaxID=104357 RepID=A0ABR3J4F5_9AGAR